MYGEDCNCTVIAEFKVSILCADNVFKHIFLILEHVCCFFFLSVCFNTVIMGIDLNPPS